MMAEWPLVGRNQTLERCGEVLGRPGMDGVALVGGPGVGKTRVLDACVHRAERAGFGVGRVTAHRSSSAIPFGALAPLLPPGDDLLASGVAPHRHTHAVLVERAAHRPLVLAVDDAQFLDDASAAVVQQLATTESVFLVLSVRLGETPPDPIAALVGGARLARLEIEPFETDDCARVLEAALGGTVDASTVASLAAASRGNALFLRELVRGSIEAGALRDDGTGWRLVAPLTASTQLRDLITARLRALPDHERLVLELLALAEPLGVELVAGLGGNALDALVEQGLITIDRSERRVELACSHPVHLDVIRDELAPLRGRRLRRQLAEAIEATGARRREDVLRVATLHLDAGSTPPANVLVPAARQAFFANDLAIAERLARRATEVEPSFDTRHLLSEVLYRLGRGGEADVEDERSLAGATDEQRALHALNRSATQFWQGGDREAADQTLADAAATLTGSWRDEIIAQRATFDVNAGAPRLALERIDGLTAAEGRPALVAALASALALPHVGRADDAVARIEPTRAVFRSLGDLISMFQMSLLVAAEASAVAELGRLDDARALAQAAVDEAARTDDTSGRAFCSLVLARVLLTQGQLLAAQRWAREAADLFRTQGHRGPLRWALGELALACALRGDQVGAADAFDGFDALDGHAATMLITDGARARAWSAMADGRVVEAREQLDAAADACRAAGQVALEVVTLHDRCRLAGSAAVAARMAALVDGTQGEWLVALAADAAAIVGDRPEELAESAERLERIGALLIAAESANRASMAFARAGRQREATTWGRRCGELVERCEGAATPALVRTGGPVPLTAREREVALLASGGLTSKDIAARLFLSPRTVDNNLARIYTKLGVNDRSALAGAMGSA